MQEIPLVRLKSVHRGFPLPQLVAEVPWTIPAGTGARLSDVSMRLQHHQCANLLATRSFLNSWHPVGLSKEKSRWLFREGAQLLSCLCFFHSSFRSAEI